ncbi:MAG: nucleotidyltransferase domain-containing protein [Ignavibacteriae bacterium]|nr:nucleotidyltransferase domain-containing protein [Ignavibacteriota bacterium]
MKLEHYPVDKLQREIVAIVARYLDLKQYKLFFFGSRVTGTAASGSDIDVGIDGPEAVPGHIMVEIRDALENLRTLYTVDIVDFKQLSQEFRQIALETTEPITVEEE